MKNITAIQAEILEIFSRLTPQNRQDLVDFAEAMVHDPAKADRMDAELRQRIAAQRTHKEA